MIAQNIREAKVKKLSAHYVRAGIEIAETQVWFACGGTEDWKSSPYRAAKMKDSRNVVRVWIWIKMDLITPGLDMWRFEWHGRGGELSVLRPQLLSFFSKSQQTSVGRRQAFVQSKTLLTIQAKPASFDVSQLAFNKHFFQSKKKCSFKLFV